MTHRQLRSERQLPAGHGGKARGVTVLKACFLGTRVDRGREVEHVEQIHNQAQVLAAADEGVEIVLRPQVEVEVVRAA